MSAVSAVLSAAALSVSRTATTRWSMRRTSSTSRVSRATTATITTTPPMMPAHHQDSWFEVRASMVNLPAGHGRARGRPR